MSENREGKKVGGALILERAWEKKLADEGLTVIKKPLIQELNEAGLVGDSLDELAGIEHEIKESLDQGVVIENTFSSEMPLNKCGLPPCKRAKLEDERGIIRKDPRLGR